MAKAPVPRRILTAVPLCDGHDSPITTINLELGRNGFEVVYLGYHQAASTIARAAVQEDVHAIGLSSYNGGHVVFFAEVIERLRARGAKDIPLFGGGGGTITAQDAQLMKRVGVRRIFFPGTPLSEMTATIAKDLARPRKEGRAPWGDRALGRAITLAETNGAKPRRGKTNGAKPKPSDVRPPLGRRRMLTIGVAGPGGAGKSTLIDELTSRFLRANPAGRVAILANDPSHPGVGGALLGDRVSAIYADDDRVFFRSLATRGSLTGISAAVPAALPMLERSGQFDLVFVESVGIGQESDPFGVLTGGGRLVDTVLFVLSPHYGGRIQLQKIPLLAGADLAVLNKCDDARAASARAEVGTLLARGAKARELHGTIASKHDDGGVDALYAAIVARGRALSEGTRR
ncbi:MAG TPA: cobalamin-dependent protein [Polyangiaceae bacterium]|nr:cobalamin-dependent protein [Polyangiaceae bacterium]